MNYWKKLSWVMGFLAVAHSAQAKDYGAGNGGQLIASEFSSAALDAVAFVNSHRSLCSRDPMYAPLCQLDLDRVRSVVASVSLTVVPRLVFQDHNTGEIIEYAALNYPEQNRIDISQTEWLKPKNCGLKKVTLAFHEYLGILGLERNNYPISSLLRMWLLAHGDSRLFVGCEEEAPGNTRCDEMNKVLTGALKESCDRWDTSTDLGRADYGSCLMSFVMEWRYSGVGQGCSGTTMVHACMEAVAPKLGSSGIFYCNEVGKPSR